MGKQGVLQLTKGILATQSKTGTKEKRERYLTSLEFKYIKIAKMEKSTIEKLNDFFASNMIVKGTPSNLEDIVHAEKELGIKFDKDYVYFLLHFGGSLIKSYEIYGLHNSEMMGEDSIISLTKRFREDEREHQDWLIIGTDYSGNPIGINQEGKVLLQDYDYGELNVLGESFEDYILKSLDS